jgi:hypothetical protein
MEQTIQVWRTVDAQRDLRHNESAHATERLYERYRLPEAARSFVKVQLGELWYPVTELSFGGFALMLPQVKAQTLGPTQELNVTLRLHRDAITVSIQKVSTKPSQGPLIEVGFRFNYREVRLLEVLRPLIRLLELGATAGLSTQQTIDGEVARDLSHLEQIDYPFELCSSNSGQVQSLVFQEGNTQFAVVYQSPVMLHFWCNIGPGAELVAFRQINDQERTIAIKAFWVFCGFGGDRPMSRNLQNFFSLLLE